MSAITPLPAYLGEPFITPIVDYLYTKHRLAAVTDRVNLTSTLQDIWTTIWLKSKPDRCIDTLLSEGYLKIKGSREEVEQINRELVRVADHDRSLLNRVITRIQRLKKFILVEVESNENNVSTVRESDDCFIVRLDISTNRLLHVLERPDHRWQLGTLDIHSDLVHELGHIDRVWALNPTTSSVWTNDEEERVITEIENPCLKAQGKCTRISHKSIERYREFQRKSVSQQIFLAFRVCVDFSFEELYSGFLKIVTWHPWRLLSELQERANDVWIEKVISAKDKSFKNQLFEIQKQMLQEYEESLNQPQIASSYKEIIDSSILFTIQNVDWKASLLREYLAKNFTHLSTEDAEAYIRIFEEVKKELIYFRRGSIKAAFVSKKFHWNDRYRQVGIVNALNWTLDEISKTKSKWGLICEKKLSLHLQAAFPDIPSVETERLVKWISQSIRKGIFKFRRNASCFSLDKPKLARIKTQNVFLIRDLTNLMREGIKQIKA